MAAAYGVNLHIVMCVDRTASVNLEVGGDVFHDDPVADASEFLASVERSLPHDTISHSISFDDPAQTLCEEADRLGARAIVVGNRRVQGLSRVLGSVASHVTRKAPCDVLIVNTTVADS
jgi:nucleotide-binding universal stress UspA family protein